MNTKRYFFSSIILFLFIFLSDFVVHGQLLKGLYEQTKHLWRSEEEMETYFSVMLMVQIAMALLISYMFTRNYEGRGIGEGIRFGALIGCFWGIMMAGAYAYMPVPNTLAYAWAVSGFVQGVLAGIILSFTYKNT